VKNRSPPQRLPRRKAHARYRKTWPAALASPLEYRVTQNAFLGTKSGLLEAIYQHNLAVAEWDRATGRYFQFSEDTAQNLH
jgi:hypothetical protein